VRLKKHHNSRILSLETIEKKADKLEREETDSTFYYEMSQYENRALLKVKVSIIYHF